MKIELTNDEELHLRRLLSYIPNLTHQEETELKLLLYQAMDRSNQHSEPISAAPSPLKRVKVFKKLTLRGNPSPEFDYDGVFHCWGTEIDHPGTYTVAIVEREDGTIDTTLPGCIQFIK